MSSLLALRPNHAQHAPGVRPDRANTRRPPRYHHHPLCIHDHVVRRCTVFFRRLVLEGTLYRLQTCHVHPQTTLGTSFTPEGLLEPGKGYGALVPVDVVPRILLKGFFGYGLEVLVNPAATRFDPAVEEYETVPPVRVEKRMDSPKIVDIQWLPLAPVCVERQEQIVWAVG